MSATIHHPSAFSPVDPTRILMTQREKARDAARHYADCASQADQLGFPGKAAELRAKAERLYRQGAQARRGAGA